MAFDPNCIGCKNKRALFGSQANPCSYHRNEPPAVSCHDGHSPVDTGTKRGWCSRCDVDMQLDASLTWVPVARQSSAGVPVVAEGEGVVIIN